MPAVPPALMLPRSPRVALQALLDVAAHNATAAAAAVAGGLTSGDEALEQGTLCALLLMGRHAGCARLAALLRGGCWARGSRGRLLLCCMGWVVRCSRCIPAELFAMLPLPPGPATCCADAGREAAALGSSGLTARFDNHARASQADCAAVRVAVRRAAGSS